MGRIADWMHGVMAWSGVPRCDCGIRRIEVRRIGDVVSFGTELPLHSLRYIEVLEDRHIRAAHMRPVERIVSFIAKGSGRLRREGSKVQPAFNSAFRCGVR